MVVVAGPPPEQCRRSSAVRSSAVRLRAVRPAPAAAVARPGAAAAGRVLPGPAWSGRPGPEPARPAPGPAAGDGRAAGVRPGAAVRGISGTGNLLPGLRRGDIRGRIADRQRRVAGVISLPARVAPAVPGPVGLARGRPGAGRIPRGELTGRVERRRLARRGREPAYRSLADRGVGPGARPPGSVRSAAGPVAAGRGKPAGEAGRAILPARAAGCRCAGGGTAGGRLPARCRPARRVPAAEPAGPGTRLLIAVPGPGYRLLTSCCAAARPVPRGRRRRPAGCLPGVTVTQVAHPASVSLSALGLCRDGHFAPSGRWR